MRRDNQEQLGGAGLDLYKEEENVFFRENLYEKPNAGCFCI